MFVCNKIKCMVNEKFSNMMTILLMKNEHLEQRKIISK